MSEAKKALESVATAKQVADMYGLNERGVRATCERGSIAAVKSAGVWIIYLPSAAAHWGNEHKS
jgi:hypothetical protein